MVPIRATHHYGLNKTVGRIRTEQCDPTSPVKEIAKKINFNN